MGKQQVATDGDETLKCVDCPNTFVFTQRDKDFFAEKGFKKPLRCKDCRQKKKDKAKK